MKVSLKYLWITSFSLLMSCKKPYQPVAISSPNSYLVVEGIINSGADSTFIKLSKTVKLAGSSTINPVINATVTVESDGGNSYPLTAINKGTYCSAGLNLNSAHKYRLNIKTADNKQYLSDFVSVLNAPAIDSVYYTIQSDGLTVCSNTNDPQNVTRYYRYDYQETWEFHSMFFSHFYSNGDTVLRRDLTTNNVYYCWKSDTSSTIVLASSADLKQDVINQNPITNIASTSYKLATEYSILVRQFALTSDAYTFWQNLKKNTEQLGSIFDAEPITINSNIHCVTNPSEAVIGYLSVGSYSTKRLFIYNQALPAWLPIYPENTLCGADASIQCFYVYYPKNSNIPVNQVNEYINYLKGAGQNPYIPLDAIYTVHTDSLIGYSAAPPICTDCTLQGTNIKPSFWK
jgi:hypothetical protein